MGDKQETSESVDECVLRVVVVLLLLLQMWMNVRPAFVAAPWNGALTQTALTGARAKMDTSSRMEHA